MIPKNVDLANTLSLAKQAISNGRCFFGTDSPKILEEFNQLIMGDTKEIWTLIFHLLEEIAPKNYLTDPPSTDPEKYTFLWKSRKMKQTMRIQFAVKKGIYYYFSLQIVPKKINQCILRASNPFKKFSR